MFHAPSPRALLTFPSVHHQEDIPEEQWQPILHSSNQVVLYNPRSHALSIAAAPSQRILTGGVVARRHRRDSTGPIGSSRQVIGDLCPYCKQELPVDFEGFRPHAESDSSAEMRWEESVGSSDEYEEVSSDPAYHSRASDYFRLLAIANETSSRRPSRSPSPYRVGGGGGGEGERHRSESIPRDQAGSAEENRSTRGAFPAEKMAEGYFKTFFQEEYKLGMGANGTVYLCQHVLDGNPLGHFAVKKIAVGESHSYLLKILKEVRLLERLHHPNIITYHHAWLENAQFSSFGPKVPTLHVLMQWAEGGSLDDFIDIRLGRKAAHIHLHPASLKFDASPPSSPTSSVHDDAEPTTPTQKIRHPRFPSVSTSEKESPHALSGDVHTRSARIRAFRAFQRAPPGEKERLRREMEQQLGESSSTAGPSGAAKKTEWTPVHLLSAHEMKSLFRDVVEGLTFLHDKSILHLDLKPGNVLLTWDEDRMIPRAMLSDFGTSRDMINSTRTPRSGNTGTLEYTAPESLPSPYTGLLRQIDSKADMWSLGMILHKLLFFKLPYRYAAVGDAMGEPLSTQDEGAKMDKLEKEILDYPGFKSTPNVVIGFDTRRLPRAYLVLLENLLHKLPTARPSSDRVSAAIREGKLDPLEASPAGADTLSVARPRVEVTTSASTDTPANAVAAVTELQSSRLLALPPPSEIFGPEQVRWRHWLAQTMWIYRTTLRAVAGMPPATQGHAKHKKRPPGAWVTGARWRTGTRVLRSTLLALKVLSLARTFWSPAMTPPRGVVSLLVLAALADTVIDHEQLYEVTEKRAKEKDGESVGSSRLPRWKARKTTKSLWITGGLALFHVVVLGASGVSWSSLWRY